MIKNYFKIAWRNLKSRKGFTFINIAGLAVSIAVCFLIVLYVKFHLDFDHFNKHFDQIYKVAITQTQGDKTVRTPITQGPLAAAMVKNIPEVQAAARLKQVKKTLVSTGQKAFYEEDIYATDPDFFKIFSFPLSRGNAKTALSKPNSIVLTQSVADKYFPHQNAIGKTLTFDRDMDYVVTGITADVPGQSHFGFSMLTPIPKKLYGIDVTKWNKLSAFHTYFKIRKDAHPDNVLAELNTVLKDKLMKKAPTKKTYFFVPLADIHLRSSLDYSLDSSRKGDIRYIYLFSAIGFLILLIACLNYINLSTARTADRYREVGIRKVVGAHRGYLFWQFIGESLLLCGMALVLAFGLVELLHPLFNRLLEQNIPLHYVANSGIILGFIAGILAIAFLAGCYPALYLSSFKPVRVLKGGYRDAASGALLRKAMVVTQFVIVVVLIMSTVVIYEQLHYVQQKNLGFKPEQVLGIPLQSDGVKKVGAELKSQLQKNSNIVSVTASSSVPAKGGMTLYAYPNGPDKKPLPLKFNQVDESYISTLGIQLAAGRNFKAIDNTKGKKVGIINQATAKAMEWSDKEAIGKVVLKRKIVGVVKDFHYGSYREKIGPALFVPLGSEGPSFITAKIKTGHIAQTMGWIRAQWKTVAPDYPLQYFFLDDAFNQLYRSEIRLGHLLTAFTLLAVFIACMGLFGLVYFMTSKRAKEIGIRKVLGAGVGSIVRLLGKDYLQLVLAGCIIALPVGYYVMSRWLANFAYKIDIDWLIFAGTAAIAVLIVFATVSWQSIKAALADPVDSLRSE